MVTKTTGDDEHVPPPPAGEESNTGDNNVGVDHAEVEEEGSNALEQGNPPADSAQEEEEEESAAAAAAAAGAPASSQLETAPAAPDPPTLQTPDGQVQSKIRTASTTSSNRRSTGRDSIDSAATSDSGGADAADAAGAGPEGAAGEAMASVSATANGSSSQRGSSAPGAYRVAPSDSSLGGARVPPPTVLTRQTVQPHTSLTSNGTPDNSTITDSFLVPEAELVVEADDGATGTTAVNGTRTTGGSTANGTSVGTGADGDDTTLRSDVIVTAIKEDEMWRACGVTLPRCVWLVLVLAGALVAIAAVLGALAGTGILGGGGGSESVAAAGSGASDNNSISPGMGGGESATSVAPTFAPTPMPTYQCEWTRFPASKDTELGNDPYNIVAIDGDTAVVGYPQENEGRGLVNILVKRDGQWEMQAILSPSEEGKADDNKGPGANFGHSVAIAGDTVIVGAPHDDKFGQRAGAAFVFNRIGDVWEQQARFVPADQAPLDKFGYDLGINDDATSVIISSIWKEDSLGTAYIFTLTDMGWEEEAKLLPDDGISMDHFGFHVDISGDIAIIGSPWRDDFGDKSGAAYIFSRTTTNTWEQQVKLVPDDVGLDHRFGERVAIDGNRAVISSWRSSSTGSAYVYKLVDASWELQTKLLPNELEEGNFGFGLGLAFKGDTVVVGAPSGRGVHPGSVHIFTLNDDETWTQQAALTPHDANQGDEFGFAVALSEEDAIIVAPARPNEFVGSVFFIDLCY